MNKKKVFLVSIIVLVVLVLAFILLRDQKVINPYSCGDIPQTGLNGTILTAEERIDRLRQAPQQNGNVIVGVPIEFIEGSTGVSDFFWNENDRLLNPTLYYLRLSSGFGAFPMKKSFVFAHQWATSLKSGTSTHLQQTL